MCKSTDTGTASSDTVSSKNVNGLPSIELLSLDGSKVNINEYTRQGKLSLVSLWATWCAPCRFELNEYKQVQASWEKKYGVEFIAISLDKAKSRNKMKSMISKNNWNFTNFHDIEGQLGTALNIRSIPQSYLINGEGEIVHSITGFNHMEFLELESIIAKHAK